MKEEQQPPSKPPSGAVKETFKIVKASLSDDLVKATQAVYQFELSGKDYSWLSECFRKQRRLFPLDRNQPPGITYLVDGMEDPYPRM